MSTLLKGNPGFSILVVEILFRFVYNVLLSLQRAIDVTQLIHYSKYLLQTTII